MILRNAVQLLKRHASIHKPIYQSFTYSRALTIGVRYNVALTTRYNSDYELSRRLGSINTENDVDIFKDDIEEEMETLKNEYSLPSQRAKEYTDILLNRIRNSETVDDVLVICNQHMNVMNDSHMMSSLRMLSTFIKNGSTDLNNILNDSTFQVLCKNIFKRSKQLEVIDLVNLLQYLCRLEVPAKSKFVQTILQLIRHQINDLDLRQLIIIEFILRKMTPTRLSEAILLSIPVLLENSLNEPELEELNIKHLSEVLSLCVRGKVPNTGLVIQEIYKRGSLRSHRTALSFLWSMLDFYVVPDGRPIILNKEDKLMREVIIKECLDMITRNMDRYGMNEMETILTKIAKAYDCKDFSCYNECFLDNFSIYCTKKNISISRSSNFIAKLLKVNFLSEDLVDYVMWPLMSDPGAINDTNLSGGPLITAITSCTDFNDRHREMIDIVLQHRFFNFDLKKIVRSTSSISLALDLLSVDYHHDSLFEILTSEEFLNPFMEKHGKANISWNELMLLHQALTIIGKSTYRVPETFVSRGKIVKKEQRNPETELMSILHEALGDASLVRSYVLSEEYLSIDHLIVLNEEGKAVKLTDKSSTVGNIVIDCLDIPENSKKIAVIDVKPNDVYTPKGQLKRYVRLNNNLLEASGFVVIPVMQSVINNLTHDEKSLYVKNLLSENGYI